MAGGAYGGNRLTRGVVGGGATDPALLVETYDYGAPYGNGGTDGGGTVGFQLVFQEASGNLVDQVGPITLTRSAASPSTPIYQIPFGKEYSTNHQQGFGYTVPGVGCRFEYTSPLASMDIGTGGTGSAVLEMILSWRWNSHNGWYLDCADAAAMTNGWRTLMNANGAHSLVLQATDGTLVSRVGSAAITSSRKNFSAGGWAKIRYVIDRPGATAYLYINGVSADSWSIATLAGKVIPANRVSFGAQTGSSSNAVGRYAELRFTQDTTTANSGGPGGG